MSLAHGRFFLLKLFFRHYQTNVILRGLVTGLNKAKAREEHIFATVPDRISELTIYTEIDNDDPWSDYSWDKY